jgi:hypothetical protein
MRVAPIVCALSSWLLAMPLPSQQEPSQQEPSQQEPAPQPAGDARLDGKVEEMRRQVQQGRAFHSHVRVTVRLKNGNKVQGIVKDGFVVERIDGMRFVAAEQNEAGAGVRLYTYKGKRNYVFLAFSDVADYRINARLSQQDVLAYERKVKEQEKARAQQVQQDKAAQPAAPLGETDPNGAQKGAAPQKSGKPDAPAADAQTGEAKSEAKSELQAMFALLEQYPPSQGWGALCRGRGAAVGCGAGLRRPLRRVAPRLRTARRQGRRRRARRRAAADGTRPLAAQGPQLSAGQRPSRRHIRAIAA